MSVECESDRWGWSDRRTSNERLPVYILRDMHPFIDTLSSQLDSQVGRNGGTMHLELRQTAMTAIGR